MRALHLSNRSAALGLCVVAFAVYALSLRNGFAFDDVVIVTGDPGAVPGGARVDVVNTATARTASTTAAEDGSFEIELEGGASDEYRVYVGSGQQSWRTRLTSLFFK